nr:reverse transcriptase domain-containing protein [Tanacetum cinerariifolium]
MQNQINVLRGDFSKPEENLRRNLNDDMINILSSFFQNQPLTSGTLLSNTIPNPKGGMKAVTTRSGLAYEGPSIPTESSLEKVDEQNTEEILDKEHSNSSERMEVCHALADLGASINLMPSSIWKKLSLPELTPTRMTLELADRSITRPKGVAEDVFVKMGKFHFPTDFVVVDFEADPRVPLILGRSFLRTGRALINVYGKEITLRVNDESITFNLDQVMKYSDNFVKRVNVINIAYEEVVHDNTKSSNPTLVFKSDFCEDPIVKTSPFGESNFFSEEIEDFLNDDSIPTGIENSLYDPEGDILYFDNLLKEDPFQLPPMNLDQEKSPMEVPKYSFSMGYKHFSTTMVTESDEVAESSAKNLVPIPHEYEVTLDDESVYNEPIKDDSFSAFTTFTNPLFNDKDDFTIHDEDFPIEESKVYLNPLFNDDEINSDELESHWLNVESNFAESLSNHDTLKFDHLEEFSGALMPIHIAEEEQIRREHAEYISLMERLITINPCPRPIVNANTNVESLPSSLIPVQDNDSQREDFGIVTDTDELLPPEPPDDEFDFELNSGEVISIMKNNIKEIYNELECVDPGEEFDISVNDEDDDCFSFMFVI